MKILIINTHSILNSGDSGILIAEIKFLREIFAGKDSQITITSRTPEIDKIFYKNIDINVITPILPAPSIVNGFFKKIKYIAFNLLNIYGKVRFLSILKKSDIVLSTGGGYFYSYKRFFPGPMYFQNYLHCKLALLAKKPLIFMPQSFGPVCNIIGTILLRDILSHQNVRKIYVRENKSIGFLESLNLKNCMQKIEYCPDMGFLLEQSKTSKFKERKISDIKRNPAIALTLRQWDFPEMLKDEEKSFAYDNYIETLSNAAENIISVLNGRIVIFPQVRGPGFFEDDRIISREFFSHIEKKLGVGSVTYTEFDGCLDPMNIIESLKRIDILIATRFHSAIFGLLALKPVISIAYQYKSSGIMQSIGLEKYCINIEDLNSIKLLSLLQEILDDYEGIISKISSTLSFVKKEIKNCLDSEIGKFK